MNNNTLIGLTGFATSGKDTFYKLCAEKIGPDICHRYAFADILKDECDPFLLEHVGISAHTSDPEQKELIRPLLVTYGTHIRRKLDQNCWINKLHKKIVKDNMHNSFLFITDVRFENEALWIKKSGGIVFNINREGIGPANPDEEEQGHLMKPHFFDSITWPTVGQENFTSLDCFISPFCEKISAPA
jgi:hypothetical protein